MPNPAPPRYLTLTHKPQEKLLERTQLVELLFALFRADNRWIVVHGDSGIGKSTLANAFFHEADQRNAYDQFGWVDYSLNLSKSIVKSFISDYEMPPGAEKNEAFYDQVARTEILKLRNQDCPQLLVFDGVESEQVVLERLDLLEIKQVNVLITTRQPFADPRFRNVTLPPLEDDDVLHFFSTVDFDRTTLTKEELTAIRGNLWLLRLLTVSTPKVSEKAAKDFLAKVFAVAKAASQSGQNLHQRIAEGLFEAATPTAAECWALLQLAALPPDRYDVERLAQYLSETDAEDADVAHLKGFDQLDEVWPYNTPDSTDKHLSALLPALAKRGWLTAHESDYSLHAMAAQVLKTRRFNDIAFFPELCNCLSVNYFAAQVDELKDNLHYENHLLHLLDFVDESSSDAYLGILWKLVTYYNETVDWNKELNCRLTLLRCSEATVSKDKKVELLHDLSETYLRLGQYEAAKKYGEGALALALSFLPEGHPQVAVCQNQLGVIYDYLGDYVRALVFLETSVASDIKTVGPDHPNVIISQANLAGVYLHLRDYIRARDLLEMCLASALKVFGPDHHIITTWQSNLAIVYDDLGDYARARDLLEASLSSNLRNLGPDHPSIATSQLNLASIYYNMRYYVRARDLLEASLSSNLRNLGPDHPTMAVSRNNLARVFQAEKNYPAAIEQFEEALRIAEYSLGREHPYFILVTEGLEAVIEEMEGESETEQ